MAISEPPKPRLSVINSGWSDPPSAPPYTIEREKKIAADAEQSPSESEVSTEDYAPSFPAAEKAAGPPPASEEPTKMWRSSQRTTSVAQHRATPLVRSTSKLPLPKPPPPPPPVPQPSNRTLFGVPPPLPAFEVAEEPPTKPSVPSLPRFEAPLFDAPTAELQASLDAGESFVAIPKATAPSAEEPEVRSEAPPLAAVQPAMLVAPLAIEPVRVSQALVQRARIGAIAAPLWALLAASGLAIGAVIGSLMLVAGMNMPSSEQDRVGAPPPARLDAAPQPAPAEPTPPAARAEPPERQLPTVEADKLNTAEQVVYLAHERETQARREARGLRERLQKEPALIDDPAIVEKLQKLTKSEITAVDALLAFAQLPGPSGADRLYEVWTKTVGRNATTELAESLLYTEDVFAKASPALRVALELRRAETCEQAAPVVERAIDDGDRRSLHLLGKLLRRSGCGKAKRQDCYACLRNDDTLNDAITAVRKRRAPKL